MNWTKITIIDRGEEFDGIQEYGSHRFAIRVERSGGKADSHSATTTRGLKRVVIKALAMESYQAAALAGRDGRLKLEGKGEKILIWHQA